MDDISHHSQARNMKETQLSYGNKHLRFRSSGAVAGRGAEGTALYSPHKRGTRSSTLSNDIAAAGRRYRTDGGDGQIGSPHYTHTSVSCFITRQRPTRGVPCQMSGFFEKVNWHKTERHSKLGVRRFD